MRRGWGFMSHLGVILAALSMMLSAYLFRYVQLSRERSVITSCQETNERHDATLLEVKRQIELLEEAGDPRAKRARAGLAATVALVEQMLPRRNCERRAERLTK